MSVASAAGAERIANAPKAAAVISLIVEKLCFIVKIERAWKLFDNLEALIKVLVCFDYKTSAGGKRFAAAGQKKFQAPRPAITGGSA